MKNWALQRHGNVLHLTDTSRYAIPRYVILHHNTPYDIRESPQSVPRPALHSPWSHRHAAPEFFWPAAGERRAAPKPSRWHRVAADATADCVGPGARRLARVRRRFRVDVGLWLGSARVGGRRGRLGGSTGRPVGGCSALWDRGARRRRRLIQ